MRRSSRSSTRSRRISCTRCDKTFSKMEHLNRHKLAHTGERPYRCSICSKSFARRDVLLRHQRNHGAQDLEADTGSRINENQFHDYTVFNNLNSSRGMFDGSSIPLTQMQSDRDAASSLQNDPSTFLCLLDNLPLDFAFPSERPAMSQGSESRDSRTSTFDNYLQQFISSMDIPSQPIQVDNQTRAAKKVQRCWPTGAQKGKISNFKWEEISLLSVINIFDSYPTPRDAISTTRDNTSSISDSTLPEISLANVIGRLKALKRSILSCDCDTVFNEDGVCDKGYLCRNTTDVFDQGFYLYMHKFQPAYPIAHLGTFSPERASDTLLFAMCMIGVSLLKTDDTIAFVRVTYPYILDRGLSHFISTTSKFGGLAGTLEKLVLAHHILFLFLSTGGNNCREKSRLFYIHALTSASESGLFCSTVDEENNPTSQSQFDNISSWHAWARAESTKNLIIGLLLHDAWLSETFDMDSVTRSDNLVLRLPTNQEIYQAAHHRRWSELYYAEYPNNDHTLKIGSDSFHLPRLTGPTHAFQMYGILCSILLRISADRNRLITKIDSDLARETNHVPWSIFCADKRASIVLPLLTQIMDFFEHTFRDSNPNCIVIWHCACMLIAVDFKLLAQAAGRDGPDYMVSAREKLALWVNTPASRRACIHAAQTFRILSHRKPADGTAFQSVRTLFLSALVLSMYLLMIPESGIYSPHDENGFFELSGTDVDWSLIEGEGFTDTSVSIGIDSPAIRFIRFGGPMIIEGKRYAFGALHAKRIILEFASLLDEVGSHWMADYAQLLYTIHDTIKLEG